MMTIVMLLILNMKIRTENIIYIKKKHFFIKMNTEENINIKKILENYMETEREYKDIQKEIQLFRTSYKKRLTLLKKELEKLEKLIVLYMEKYNFPAIKYNDRNFSLKEQKRSDKFLSRKKKEASLDNIKKKYNLSDDVVENIYNNFIGEQSVLQKLKLK